MTAGRVRRVEMPAALGDRIVAWCRGEVPHEACGLLLGHRDRIIEARPARNVDPQPAIRYLVAPDDHFSAIREARRRGLDVVGAYHSHPAGPARPSARDRSEAGEHFLYVIVGLAPELQMTAWALEAGNFVGVSLVRT